MLHVDISSLIRPTEGIVPGMDQSDVIEGVSDVEGIRLSQFKKDSGCTYTTTSLIHPKSVHITN